MLYIYAIYSYIYIHTYIHMCTHSSWASFRGIRQVKRRTVEALEQVGQPWKLMERCASSHRKLQMLLE